MNRSESFKELAAALAKAQGAMEDAEKDVENPGFKRDGKAMKYADLASVHRTVRKPLSDTGLSFIQAARSTDTNRVEVETMLMHTSGEFISETLSMPVIKVDPQGFGSALTYARRYSLMAMLGIAAASDDDDGNAAGQAPREEPNRRGGVTFSPPAPSPQAIAFGRQFAALPTFEEIQKLKKSAEFTTEWKAMNDVDRDHITRVAGERIAKLAIAEARGEPVVDEQRGLDEATKLALSWRENSAGEVIDPDTGEVISEGEQEI